MTDQFITVNTASNVRLVHDNNIYRHVLHTIRQTSQTIDALAADKQVQQHLRNMYVPPQHFADTTKAVDAVTEAALLSQPISISDYQHPTHPEHNHRVFKPPNMTAPQIHDGNIEFDRHTQQYITHLIQAHQPIDIGNQPTHYHNNTTNIINNKNKKQSKTTISHNPNLLTPNNRLWTQPYCLYSSPGQGVQFHLDQLPAHCHAICGLKIFCMVSIILSIITTHYIF